MRSNHVFAMTVTLMFGVPMFSAAGIQPPDRPETTEEPAAKPEVQPVEYPEYTKSVESIVNAAFETISGGKGVKRDWDKYRSLFSPDAKLVSIRVIHTSTGIATMTVDELIKAEGRYFEGAGYFEKPINLKVQEFGHMAHVLAPYESRRQADDEKPYLRGVYSIQLIQTEGRWWILNMMWQGESAMTPIPEEFLKS